MNRSIMIAALVGALAVPATAVAGPQPTSKDKRNAQSECRAERGDRNTPEREAFNAQYRNFGRCVSQRARDEHAERHRSRRSASRDCRSERRADRAAFREKYGKNRNKRNAMGRCVSQQTRANERAEDRKDREERQDRQNAAEQCDAERDATGVAAFRAKYGKNANDRNAFGKCVSEQAKAQQDDQPQQSS